MDGVHDMGGMHGFGPVDRDEASYHEEWEVRVHGISNALAAPGGGRYSLESLDPAEYLGSSYYKRWLLARIKTLQEHGKITQEELDAAITKFEADPNTEMPEDDPEEYERAAEAVKEARKKAGDSSFPPGAGPDTEASDAPRFKVGDRVVAKTIHPIGHTRLPRYVRGRVGEVISLYRPQGFQDHAPIDGRAGTQPMYAVRFDGRELWGDQAEPNSTVVLDMWESYLEQA